MLPPGLVLWADPPYFPLAESFMPVVASDAAEADAKFVDVTDAEARVAASMLWPRLAIL